MRYIIDLAFLINAKKSSFCTIIPVPGTVLIIKERRKKQKKKRKKKTFTTD